MALNGVVCFGKTPAEAYEAWKKWQDHVKTLPFAFLEVSE